MSPAIKFIARLFLESHPITAVLFCADIIEKSNRGVPIPNPKSKKLNRLLMKLVVDVLIANNIISDAGLQGRTIAPKNNPNMNALNRGFFLDGGIYSWENSSYIKIKYHKNTYYS